jgi:hypothetical protein
VEIRQRRYILHEFIIKHCIYLTCAYDFFVSSYFFSTLGRLLHVALESITKPFVSRKRGSAREYEHGQPYTKKSINGVLSTR